jgi:putative flippase GtrA
MWWAKLWAWTCRVAEPAGLSKARRGVSRELLRYLAAGLANTAVGYGVFLFLHAVAGVAPHAANAASYGVGLLAALVLNRYFVFRGARITSMAVSRFAAGFGFAYALNWLVLSVGLSLGLPRRPAPDRGDGRLHLELLCHQPDVGVARARDRPMNHSHIQPEPMGVDLAWILVIGVLSRVWVFGVAWLFNFHFGMGREPLSLLCSWDCGWYQSIADTDTT